MKSLTKKAHVPFSAKQMYDLVNDVAAYKTFMPYCKESLVLINAPDHMQASLTFGAYGIEKSFTTDNQLEPGEKITIRLVEGPFESLSGYWSFEPDGINQCDVTVSFSFEVTPLIRPIFEPLFEEIASSWLSVFVARAHKVYGR
jgi:ribosome-associated toxin RatA of RatAB toxin-antitoxin module